MKKLITLSILLMAFTLISCEESDDDAAIAVEAVWQNQFYFGNTRINGEDVLTSEMETANTFIRDRVCFQNLPNGFLQTFSFNIYIPQADDSQAGFDTNEFVIFYDGVFIEMEPILTYIRVETIDGMNYAKFLIGGQFFENEISRENFQQLRFGFDMIHRNPDTEEEYNRDGKFIEINFDPC